MKSKVVKKKAKKSVAIVKFNIDTVCNMFIEGAKWKDIADHFSMPVSSLHYKVSANPEYFARAKEAREISAESYADKAEQVLIMAQSNGVEIQRARELAQHYRWMAGKRNPKKYGERVDVTTDGEKINSPVFVVNAVVHNEIAKLGDPAKELPESTDH